MSRRPIWIDWGDLAALEARRDVVLVERDAAERLMRISDGDVHDRISAIFDAADHELALLDNRIGELEEAAYFEAKRAERREYWRAVVL